MLSHRRHPLHTALLVLLVVSLSVPITLFSTPQTTLAQDDNSAIIVAGSRYLDELFNTLYSAYREVNENAPEFKLETEGNNNGFERLCDGSASLALATREITDAEIIDCQNNAVEFVELLLALDALVLVANTNSGVACISTSQLSRLFLQSTAPNWSILSPDAVDAPINIYGPANDSRAFSILSALLNDTDPTVGYTVFSEPAEVLETLQDASNNALAFMTLAQWSSLASTDGVEALSLNTDQNPECTPATSAAVSSREYPASRLLMLYANAASLSQVELSNFLQYGFGTGESAVDERPISAIVNSLGFSVPPQAIYDRDLNNIRGPIAGRTFSRGNSPVALNTATTGQIDVKGVGVAEYATGALYNSFNSEFVNITVKRSAAKNDSAWASFCAGEASVIQVSRPATESELAACAENGVTPSSAYLGSQAVVLVTAATSELPVCINYAELSSLLVSQAAFVPAEATPETSDETAQATEEPTDEATPEASNETAQATEEPADEATPEASDEAAEPTEEPADEATPEASDETTEATDNGDVSSSSAASQGPTRWNEINAAWPDLPILVLAPQLGAFETDLVLSAVAPGPSLRRTDAPVIQETPADSGLADLDYRLGGLVNFDGAVAYVLLSDFEAYANKSELRIIEINGGNDCVSPSVETLGDNSYGLSFSSYLVVSQESLSDPLIAAFLWHVYSRAGLDVLEALHLTGFDRATFEARREELFGIIQAAQAVQSTPEEGVETEPTATEESSTEATEEASPTAEATEEVEPTVEATEVVPTEEPTEAPTEEASPEATPEATSEATPQS